MIKEFIKAELKGWKKTELAVLAIIFSIILINGFITKDNIIAIVSAFCGILYSTIAGKGKISCYFFGIAGTCCYSWLSFSNALYGNLILYMCYYLPMQITGIFAWKKHLNEKKEIVKKALTTKQRIYYLIIAFVLCIISAIFLKFLNSANPIFDGITTTLSIFGMYFTVKRYIEQWIVWIIVNSLSSIMWLQLILNGTKAYATLIMWVVYTILAFYFYFQWKKELLQQ